MLQSTWLAFGGFSMLMTLGWLYRPTERTTFTALFSGAGWALLAITATDLQRLTETGERVSASVGIAPQLFLVGLSLLSLLAAFLYRWGLYPPEQSPEEE
jgi:hypothetical protein